MKRGKWQAKLRLKTGNNAWGEIDNLTSRHFETVAAAEAARAATLSYGMFLNTIINFLIVSFAIFLLVRQVNKLRAPAPVPAAPALKPCAYCCSQIPSAATRCPNCTSQL
jgi:large conductance mechanosensitive channel